MYTAGNVGSTDVRRHRVCVVEDFGAPQYKVRALKKPRFKKTGALKIMRLKKGSSLFKKIEMDPRSLKKARTLKKARMHTHTHSHTMSQHCCLSQVRCFHWLLQFARALVEVKTAISEVMRLPPRDAVPLLFHCLHMPTYSLPSLFRSYTFTRVDVDFARFIASSLTEGAEFWIDSVKYKVDFVYAVHVTISNCNYKVLDLLLQIADVFLSLESFDGMNYQVHSDANCTAQSVIAVFQLLTPKWIRAGCLRTSFNVMLSDQLYHIPYLLKSMASAGLSMGQICLSLCENELASSRLTWQPLARADFQNYIEYYNKFPAVLDGLQTQRRFRTTRVGTLWHNKDLLRLVCEYVIDYSEEETDAIQDCIRLLKPINWGVLHPNM
jgi:hypothetical protein